MNWPRPGSVGGPSAGAAAPALRIPVYCPHSGNRDREEQQSKTESRAVLRVGPKYWHGDQLQLASWPAHLIQLVCETWNALFAILVVTGMSQVWHARNRGMSQVWQAAQIRVQPITGSTANPLPPFLSLPLAPAQALAKRDLWWHGTHAAAEVKALRHACRALRTTECDRLIHNSRPTTHDPRPTIHNPRSAIQKSVRPDCKG